MSILVVGSVALDNIKTPCDFKKDVLGGSAVYFSAAASFFNRVNLVGVVGKDFPRKYITLLEDKNVGIKGLEINPKADTFRWEGEYKNDFADALTLATYLNAFAEFNPYVPKDYQNSQYLFLANIDPDLQQNVLKQMKRPKLIIADTMNFWITSKKNSLTKLITQIDILIINSMEAKLFTEEHNLLKAAQSILKMGPKILIIKKGENGAMLFSKSFMFSLPAFVLGKIVDPTGAGDSFAGGFVGYLSSVNKITPKALKQALVYGNIIASFAVEDFSPKKLFKITKSDIISRYKKYKNLISI